MRKVEYIILNIKNKYKIDNFLNKNYTYLMNYCKKINKGDDVYDFFHQKITDFYSCISWWKLEKLQTEADMRKYFKVVLRNEFYSKTSKYRREMNKEKDLFVPDIYDDDYNSLGLCDLFQDEIDDKIKTEELYVKMFDIINNLNIDSKKRFFYTYLLKQKIDYNKNMRTVAKELCCNENTIYADYRNIIKILREKMFNKEGD